MTIEAGKTYRNATNERRRVDRVEDGTVHFTYPASLKDGQQPLADFEAWAVGEYVDPFA